jgi:hypothetical protein
MSPAAVRAETILGLRRQLVSSQKSRFTPQCIPTGLSTLDQLLPNGGVPVSSLVEWISEDSGQAAASMALRSISQMLVLPGCLTVIDERHDFHADAARAQGIPLSRLLIVRPRRQPDAPVGARSRFVRRTSASECETLWALEQAARCSGVRVILCWLDRASSSVMRRLQLAIERSGVTIMLIRSAAALSQASFADLRLHVRAMSLPASASRPEQRVKQQRDFSVQLLRSRHGIQHEGSARLCQDPWDEQLRSCSLAYSQQ